MEKFFKLLIFAVAATTILPVGKAAADCKQAVDAYNTAIQEISSTMKRNSRCISNSEGHDECSSEFRRLKSAQGDFESVVSDYGFQCR